MDFLFGDIKDGRVAFALLFSPPSAAGFMAWRQIVIYKATVKKMLMDDIMSFGEIFTYYDSSDIRKEIYSYPFLEKSQLFSEFKYVNYDESWISARDGVKISKDNRSGDAHMTMVSEDGKEFMNWLKKRKNVDCI